MDIGNQQRVIIVELEEAPCDPPPVPSAEADGTTDTVAEWPLPIELDPDPVG